MKMSTENYNNIVNGYREVIERVGMKEIQNHITNVIDKDSRVKDRTTRIVWDIYRGIENHYQRIVKPNYDLGLHDSHIQTGLIKAAKEVGIIKWVSNTNEIIKHTLLKFH